jgi:hypothetical protein
MQCPFCVGQPQASGIDWFLPHDLNGLVPICVCADLGARHARGLRNPAPRQSRGRSVDTRLQHLPSAGCVWRLPSPAAKCENTVRDAATSALTVAPRPRRAGGAVWAPTEPRQAPFALASGVASTSQECAALEALCICLNPRIAGPTVKPLRSLGIAPLAWRAHPCNPPRPLRGQNPLHGRLGREPGSQPGRGCVCGRWPRRARAPAPADEYRYKRAPGTTSHARASARERARAAAKRPAGGLGRRRRGAEGRATRLGV